MLNRYSLKPLLEISLLGGFQVKVDGQPVVEKHWVRNSAKSLVKLLALKPLHAMHREQVMDMLWTVHSLETASNNLNKAIYRARRALEPDLAKGSHSQFILTQNKQIILQSPGSLRVDLDEFERLANFAISENKLEAGQKAIELYRGDLLAEDIYEDWTYPRRESIRILYRKAATKTANMYADHGNYSKSIQILKELIAHDDTDEHIHRLLMRFYAETGSRYQALKQFEQCREALQTLRIAPESETFELEQSIKRGEIFPTKQKLKTKASETIINSAPEIIPLASQNGLINSARFMPDGKSVILSATWQGGNNGLYANSFETGELKPLGLEDAELFSVSPSGDLALNTKPFGWFGLGKEGTLKVLPSKDEKPIEITKNVRSADWLPTKNLNSANGGNPKFDYERSLAIVRSRNGKDCLEYPVGNIIYETGGWITFPRFSPDGKKIAFIEHPIAWDDEGFIVTLDLVKNNEKKILTDNWLTILGLAWNKDEIWFTASREGPLRMLWAVNLNGEERLIYRKNGNLKLHDCSQNGEVLITDERRNLNFVAKHADDEIERDLSWHNNTFPRDISADGKMLLVEEGGVTESAPFFTYIRNIDGTFTRKIGNGAPMAFSPDNKYALVRKTFPLNHLALIEIKTGETIPLSTDPENSLVFQQYGCFFPDGKRILFSANKLDQGTGVYVQNITGGKPVCLTKDDEEVKMFSQYAVSPDNKCAVLKNSAERLALYQISDGSSKPLKNLNKDFYHSGWSEDGEHIFVRRWREIPTVVYRYNLISGKKEKWLEVVPKDTTGVGMIVALKLTPDGKTYVYSFLRELSDLYLLKNFQ